MLRREVPEIGIIEMPALGERWQGAVGQATTMASGGSERECRTRHCRTMKDATFYTTSPLYFDAADWSAVEAIAQTSATARFGGDCYSYGLLAAGHIDLVVEARLEPYDYLPLIPIVEGAGAVVSDWRGDPLSLDSDGRVVAAATPELHAEALPLLPD